MTASKGRDKRLYLPKPSVADEWLRQATKVAVLFE